jgi:tetratricopeptide (TPR) repeat protein
VLAQQLRYDEAEQQFRQALDCNPHPEQLAKTLTNYGNVLAQQLRYDEAEQQFRQALASNDKDAKTLTNYGNVLAQQLRYDEAEQQFRQALACNPTNATTLTNYGNVLAQQQRYEEAEELFRQALACNPTNAITLASYATALVNQGRWADANQRFEEALKIDASNAQTLTNYADALAQQERYDEAEQQFRKALASNDKDATTLTNYGNVLAQQLRYKRAFDKLEQALKYAPDNPITRSVYGKLLMQVGSYKEACAQFEQSLGLHLDRQTEVSTRFLYAVALQSLKRYDEAIAQLQQIQPEQAGISSFVVVSIMLGRLFYITGQVHEGDQCFKRAQQQLESLGEAAGERDRARVAAKSLDAAQAVFAQRPYSEQGWGLLQQVGEEMPQFREAYRLMTLNASQEQLFEMMKPENPDPYDAQLLNRAIYHKIANEIAILKSISQFILMSAEDEGGAEVESLRELVKMVEDLEQHIETKRQNEKKELQTIPADSYEQIIKAVSETAHDIADNANNELSVVKSEVQWLLSEHESGATRDELEQFLEQVELSLQAIDDLKSVNEGNNLNRTTVRVAELFEKWRQMPKIKGAAISLSTENGDEQIRTDVEKIRSMLSELVENAISHNPDHKDLQIGITSQDVVNPWALGVKFTSDKRYLQIIIEDDGQGVPKEKKGQIFLPLSTEEKGLHSGLGLYIIRRTLKEMDGYILETGKHGARFEIYIPYEGEDDGE